MESTVKYSPWYLLKVSTGERIPLRPGISAVGRVSESTILLDSNFCSRKHCQFVVGTTTSDPPKIVDFSSNGTFVNGKSYVNLDILLSDGDRIGIGCWGNDNLCISQNLPIYTLHREPEEPQPALSVGDRTETRPHEGLFQTVINVPEKEHIVPVIEVIDSDEDGLNLSKYECEEPQKQSEVISKKLHEDTHTIRQRDQPQSEAKTKIPPIQSQSEPIKPPEQLQIKPIEPTAGPSNASQQRNNSQLLSTSSSTNGPPQFLVTAAPKNTSAQLPLKSTGELQPPQFITKLHFQDKPFQCLPNSSSFTEFVGPQFLPTKPKLKPPLPSPSTSSVTPQFLTSSSSKPDKTEPSKTKSIPETVKTKSTPEPGKAKSTPEPGKTKSTPEPGKAKSTPEPGKTKSTPEVSKPKFIPDSSKTKAASEPGKLTPNTRRTKPTPPSSKNGDEFAKPKSKQPPEKAKDSIMPMASPINPPQPLPSTSTNFEDIVEISDDDDEKEELEFQMSQSFMFDIKQEIADLDTEQSFEIKPETLPEQLLFDNNNAESSSVHDQNSKSASSNNKQTTSAPDYCPSSPMFILLEDDDSDDSESVSNWARKLSQSFTLPFIKTEPEASTSKVPSETDSKNDTVQTKDKFNYRESKHREIKYQESRQRDGKDRQDFKVAPTKRKLPEVIVAPSLPAKRGRCRGVSAHVSPKAPTPRKETDNKYSILSRVRQGQRETSLKENWRKKPNVEREEEKQRHHDINEERKLKLKEIARESEARKRKSHSDEVKVIKKPKVKNTHQNRGAFLAETPDYETAKREVLSKKIPKLQPRKSEAPDSSPIESTSEVRRTRSLISTSTSMKQLDHRSKGSERHSINSDKPKERTESSSDVNNKDTLTTKSQNDKLIQHKSSEPRRVSTNEPQLSTGKSSDKKSQNRQKLKGQLAKQCSTDLKSILKPLGTIKKTHKRSVKFDDRIETRYYDIDECNAMVRKVNGKDVPIDMTSFLNPQIKPLVDYSELILNDVLGWDPKWLKTGKQQVNGSDNVLLPMMHQFKTFVDFEKIVIPLFKIEMWYGIEQDFQRRLNEPFEKFRMNQIVFEKNRLIFHCETGPISSKNFKNVFCPTELCMLKGEYSSKRIELFGFIKASRITNISASRSILQVTIEFKANIIPQTTFSSLRNIEIKPISNIRVEIGAFNAINHLQNSSLGNCIINPFELARDDVKEDVKDIRYVGFNSLNTNQQSILINSYWKSVDSTRKGNISLIEGPPGTGKSRVITNLSLQILYGKEVRTLSKRILICSQSNAAIDIIAMKLIEIRGKMDRDKFNLIRFGVLDRIHASVQPYSTQKLIHAGMRAKQSDASLKSLKDEKIFLDARIAALSINAGSDNVFSDELDKLKTRYKLIEKLELNIPDSQLSYEEHYPKYLGGAHIVCTTLSSCIKLLQYTNYFDVCIIDEATQCLEPWTLIPLEFGISSLVLVGDTQQLPATVLSQITKEYGFGVSLFTRIQKCLEGSKNNPIQTLKTQYRMHTEICKWPNLYFYKNQLTTDKSATSTASLLKPYSVLSLHYNQNNEQKAGKITNVLEAKFIVELVLKISNIIPPKYFTYGIITPYAHQRDYLQSKINESGIKNVLVNTIDSYQGKEKDVIIISSVRTKGIGFLGNCQRLNVALTRAKKCLILCGNFSSLGREPVWRSLLDNAKQRGLFYNVKENDVEDFDNKVMCHLKVELAAEK